LHEVQALNNPARQRFEIIMENHLAKLNYREHDGTIELVHTEVPEELAGRGLANKLAEAALSYARAENLKVVPSCSFVAKYIARHPEWQSLLT
jgi:predicted GNAT family acetyltransferase